MLRAQIEALEETITKTQTQLDEANAGFNLMDLFNAAFAPLLTFLGSTLLGAFAIALCTGIRTGDWGPFLKGK